MHTPNPIYSMPLFICQELANYGEYSGAPSEQMTYNYAKTILGLMTRVKDDKGKVRCCPLLDAGERVDLAKAGIDHCLACL